MDHVFQTEQREGVEVVAEVEQARDLHALSESTTIERRCHGEISVPFGQHDTAPLL